MPSLSRGAFVNEIVNDAPGDLPDCPEGARLIPLTKGYFAIVDAADFERLAQHKWRVQIGKDGETYAHRQYRVRGTKRRILVIMHREIMGAPDGVLVDHRDGDGLNNRRGNLRFCTRAGNSQNRRKSVGRRFKGVYPTRKKQRPYYSMIVADRVLRRLGRYATETEAALAYDAAARRLHGEFANLNFPDAALALHGENNAGREQPCVRGILPP